MICNVRNTDTSSAWQLSSDELDSFEFSSGTFEGTMMRTIAVDRKAQGNFYALGTQAKVNRETGEQLKSRDGQPQWVVEVLLRPHQTKDGIQPSSDVERVTVPGEKTPEFAPMTQLDFPGLTASHYDIQDGPNGISLRAEGVKAL